MDNFSTLNSSKTNFESNNDNNTAVNPRKETVDFILNFSKALETKKAGSKDCFYIKN